MGSGKNPEFFHSPRAQSFDNFVVIGLIGGEIAAAAARSDALIEVETPRPIDGVGEPGIARRIDDRVMELAVCADAELPRPVRLLGAKPLDLGDCLDLPG